MTESGPENNDDGGEGDSEYTWETEWFTPTQNMDSVTDSEISDFDSLEKRRRVRRVRPSEVPVEDSEQDVSVVSVVAPEAEVPVDDSEQDVSVESAPIGSFMYLLGGMEPVHTVTEQVTEQELNFKSVRHGA